MLNQQFVCNFFTVSENEHVILILLHHIVGDGWSLQPLTRDFTAAYKARCQGNKSTARDTSGSIRRLCTLATTIVRG
ncbi:condensation domain-containing protein [Bacillus pacificus]